MMTQPSATRLLEVVRKELSDNVLPGIADPHTTANLQMVLHVLETIGVRVEHEIAWMCEEIGAAAELAASIGAEMPVNVEWLCLHPSLPCPRRAHRASCPDLTNGTIAPYSTS